MNNMPTWVNKVEEVLLYAILQKLSGNEVNIDAVTPSTQMEFMLKELYTNIGTSSGDSTLQEVVEARKGKAKLVDKITELEGKDAGFNDFKANGGAIGGDVNLTNGAISSPNANEFIVKSRNKTTGIGIQLGTTSEGLWYTNLGNFNTLRKYGSSADTDLGETSIPFRDIYLSGLTKEIDGYTKLPNGLILQWGNRPIEQPCNGSWAIYNFPVSFPNKALTIVGNSNYDGSTCYSPTFLCHSKSEFNVYAPSQMFTGQRLTRMMWFAIGY